MNKRQITALLLMLASALMFGTTVQSATNPNGVDLFSSPASSINQASPYEAGFLVKVQGPGTCSGSPIKGTNLVITAAHCVMEPGTGAVGKRYDLRVEHNDTRFNVVEVYLDMEVSPLPHPEDDVAILVLDRQVPGAKLEVASSFDGKIDAKLIGYQPSTGWGSWLRGEDYSSHRENLPTSFVARPAVCKVPAGSAEWVKDPGIWSVSCGFVPGASGGPLVAVIDGKPALVGVASTVNKKLTHNGIAPLAKVLELLENGDKYRRTIDGPSVSWSSSGNQR